MIACTDGTLTNAAKAPSFALAFDKSSIAIIVMTVVMFSRLNSTTGESNLEVAGMSTLASRGALAGNGCTCTRCKKPLHMSTYIDMYFA